MRGWVVRIPLLGVLLMVLFGGGLTARAQYLRATFSDFEGDHLGGTDLIRMSLTFHPVTGAYEVVLESTSNDRFGERFVLGINVFNADLGTFLEDPTYFHDEAEVVGQACSVSIHRLQGTNLRLTEWSEGDRVAASGPVPLGVPLVVPFGVRSFTSGVAFLGDRDTPEDAVGEGDSTVLISVSGFETVRFLPDAQDDLFSLFEDDGPTLLDVLVNDCSVILSPNPISIIDVSFPFVRGTVEFDARGITYTPLPNFFGIERLEYTIQDLNGLNDTASVLIDVRSVNDDPVANDDIFSLEEDSESILFDPLENDSFEPDINEDLNIVDVEEISGLRIVGTQIEYTPPPDFFGQQTVGYTISDGNEGFASATIRFEVLPVNDPPFAGSDEFEINGRLSSHSLDVLANDSISPDVGEQLVLLGFEADERLGAVRIEGANLVLEPTGFFEGEGQIIYTIGDGRRGEAIGSVVVTVVLPNLDPIALDDRFEILEDQAALFDPLANDTTLPDLDEILGLASLGESESGASLFIEGGKIRYLPPEDFFGEDFFEYLIEDGRGGSAQATVTVSVTNINDPPSVVDDRFETFEDSGVQRFDVLANDSVLPDKDELLTLESVELRSGEGTIGIHSGLLEVRSADDFNGLIEVVYRVEDGNQGSAVGVASIVVESVNDPPIAKLDLVTVTAGQEVIAIDVLGNDLIAPDENEQLLITNVFSNQVKGGEVSHDGHIISFIPADGFHGTESFRYGVSDGNGGQSSALVVLTIVPLLIQPVALDDEVELLEDSVATIEVLANDTIDSGELEALSLSIVRNPELGTAQVVDGNRILYRPAADVFGQDSLEYQVAYESGESAVGVLKIVVVNQNDPPTAKNDQFTIEEDSGLALFPVLDNDTFLPDPEELLTLIAVTPTESGGEVSLSEGRLSYQPPAHFFGSDSFSYAIQDEAGDVANASVTIVVNSVNDPPQLMDDSLSIAAETAEISIDVLSNDSTAPELDERLELIGVTQGEHGAKVSVEDGKVVYVPAAGFVGLDRFTYSAGDGNGGVALAEVNITVLAVDQSPRALGDFYEVNEDDAGVRLGVIENDESGAVGDAALEILSVTQGSNGGRLEIDGSGVIYSPSSDFFGVETFAYRLIEKGLESDFATVTVTVLPQNDSPLAVNDMYVFENPGEILLLDVLINDSIAPDEEEMLAIIEFRADSTGGRIEEEGEMLQYTAFPEFEGVDTFDYTISDGNGGVSTATVTVEIVRFDVTPPVVVCRDIEVVLDRAGS
ncbi:MAG: tandem-95 repeat protein, partial [Verrucomicrobia bacterium]|nr:tandem-95 repeat protein [Verrucomicrobiota bacterium]